MIKTVVLTINNIFDKQYRSLEYWMDGYFSSKFGYSNAKQRQME